ncbi:MAG: M20/M25/M40 family metallo-hydrolase [Pirellulaceae bacterium]
MMEQTSSFPRPSIDGDRLVAQFLQFVQIDSPSLDEAPFVQALSQQFGALGLAATNDGTGQNGVGNLLAVLPGTDRAKAPVLFSMHMDTVEPGRGIRPRIADGIIRSDGGTVLGADNKAAVAAVLEAVRCLQAARPVHGDVELLFTWGEERGLRGSLAFDTSRLRSRIGFCPDGGGPVGTIITQAPYHSVVRATFIGRASHAGLEPENGINALTAAARALDRMPLGRIDAQTTANVGRITGGTARNIVPDRVEIEGEARSLDLCKLERQLCLMVEAMSTATRETGCTLETDVQRQYPGFHIGDGDLPVRIAAGAIEDLGLRASIESSGGGGDANNLNSKGIQTVVLGVGGNGFHSTTERIAVADLVHLAELIVVLAIRAGRASQ